VNVSQKQMSLSDVWGLARRRRPLSAKPCIFLAHCVHNLAATFVKQVADVEFFEAHIFHAAVRLIIINYLHTNQ